MSFNEVNRGGRSFFSHPAANNARGRGGFLGVDDKLSIHHVPFTVRGDTPVWGEFTPVLPSPIARVTGAPFDPVFVLENGMKIRCEATAPDGFEYGDAALSLVYEIPLASLPAPRADGKIELKRLEVTGGLELALQGDLTPEEVAMGGEPRTGDVLHSIAAYTQRRNNANYADSTKTHAETGKALQIRTPEVVFKSQGGIELGRAFIRWEIQREDNRTFIVKVADFSALPTPQETAFIETAATFGYTSIGASKIGGTGTEHVWGSLGTMPENGTVSQHSYYNNHLTRSSTVFTGLYLEDSTFPTDPGALVTDSQTAEHSIVVSQWNDFIPDTTTHEVSQDDELWMFVSFSIDAADALGIAYDLVGGGVNLGKFTNSGQNLNDTMPDPFSSQGFVGVATILEAKLSIYITYEAGGGASLIPQIMHHRRMMRQ